MGPGYNPISLDPLLCVVPDRAPAPAVSPTGPEPCSLDNQAGVRQGELNRIRTDTVRLLAGLAAACPTRPVDWRWQRAGLLLDLGLRCRRHDGESIHQARRYRAALSRCRVEADHRRLNARMPALAGAYALATGPALPRAIVEARLLAGESPDRIASKEALTPDAVAVYEAQFFNIADRLGCRGYVNHMVLGPLGPGIPLEETGRFLKFIAYYGGQPALDLGVTALLGMAAGADSIDETTRVALERLQLAAAPPVPVRSYRRQSATGQASQSRIGVSRRKRRVVSEPKSGKRDPEHDLVESEVGLPVPTSESGRADPSVDANAAGEVEPRQPVTRRGTTERGESAGGGSWPTLAPDPGSQGHDSIQRSEDTMMLRDDRSSSTGTLPSSLPIRYVPADHVALLAG